MNKIPVCYTIGPIDAKADKCKSEFDYCESQLLAIGHKVINPVKNEPTKTGMNVSESVRHLQNLWRTGNIEEFLKMMKSIWKADLKAVKEADYLVLHFEEDDSGVGTILEMTMASIPALLGMIHSEASEGERVGLTIAKVSLEQAGFFKKPIYWVCKGATTPINSTLKMLVYISGGQVFKTYKELTEYLTKIYGVMTTKSEEEKK